MKNCPFCNGELITIAQTAPKGPYAICCRSCGAMASWGLSDKELTKNIWNRRNNGTKASR